MPKLSCRMTPPSKNESSGTAGIGSTARYKKLSQRPLHVYNLLTFNLLLPPHVAAHYAQPHTSNPSEATFYLTRVVKCSAPCPQRRLARGAAFQMLEWQVKDGLRTGFEHTPAASFACMGNICHNY
eukprot:2581925-Amphidinium_carterae.1